MLRVRDLVLLAVLIALVPGVSEAQYDLAVIGVTGPSTMTIGSPGSFVISLGGTTGPSGVTVTAIFTREVTFNPPPASSTGCAANTAVGDSSTVTCPATGSSSLTISVTPVSAGSFSVVAGVIGNESDPAMTNNSWPPFTVTVTGSGSPSVTGITPKAGSSAGNKGVTITGTSFQAGATVTIGGSAATGVVVVSATQITALTPAHAAGAGTVTVSNQGGGSGSLTNGYTFMATVVFADDPIIQYSTLVRAQHILDLRSAVAALWSVAGLGTPGWTNAVTSGASIYAIDVQEIRTKLNQARLPLGYSASSFSDNPLQGQITLIKKAHIDELRNGVKQVTN